MLIFRTDGRRLLYKRQFRCTRALDRSVATTLESNIYNKIMILFLHTRGRLINNY